MGEREQDQAEAAHWEDFGKWLAQLRRDRGLTQQAVADRTSVSPQNLVSLEHGGYRRYADGPWILPNPRDDTLAALASAYGVKVEEMFERVGRYNDRPQTRSSLRRVSRRRVERSDRVAELEKRIEMLEAEVAAMRERSGQPASTERQRRRRASG